MKRLNLFYGSSYDRGLDMLLYIWGSILEKYPDAKLHIAYGWDGFVNRFKNNPERMQWKNEIDLLMQQEGVIHYGRVGKKELEKIRNECGIWAYPTYFHEINCITALEAQNEGLVPVTMDLAALSETVGSGFKIKGDIRQKDTLEEYLNTLLKVMGDKKLWKEESKKAIKFAKKFKVQKLAPKWLDEIKSVNEPKVTIFTPTIRQGFWNIQAHNIANQTYKNLEWVVVDDFKENREHVMKKYCDKYGIEYQYIWKPKRNVQRMYGLSSANNVAIKHAKGELIVWLQDFVLMPEDGVERLVDLYRHHPYDFLAPVDYYYKPKIKPDTTSEDWFNGRLDVVGPLLRKNIRAKRLGIRYSETVTDLELNYAAIPKKLLTDLNGFWEFYDEALGFDDTEIVYRGFELGARLVIDDTNIAKCIDHWEALESNPEQHGVNRTHNLNDPRFYWMIQKMKKGELPVVRTQKLDDSIDLKYTIPPELSKDQAVEYMRENMESIIEKWS